MQMGHLALIRFDAVVTGTNAYLIREELRRNASRFLDYVKQGGTLIVQYQGYRYQTPGFAPYPFQYNQPHMGDPRRSSCKNTGSETFSFSHAQYHYCGGF